MIGSARCRYSEATRSPSPSPLRVSTSPAKRERLPATPPSPASRRRSSRPPPARAARPATRAPQPPAAQARRNPGTSPPAKPAGSGSAEPRPMACRTCLRQNPAVLQRHPHFGAEMLAAVHAHLGMRRGVDPRQQRADFRIAETVADEVFQLHRAIGQRARQAVLHAELGIQFTVRIRAVGVRQPARMGPGIHTLHLSPASGHARAPASASHRPPDACCRSTDTA